MSIPVPRAPKTRFTAPARAVPAPEEVSAGGLIIDFDRPEQLPVAIIARINRNGQREWCLPKGHIEHGETTVEAAQREISEETGITGYPVASLGTIAYWFTSNG
ncbi:NUDIX domain-containing protein, partial [uncultured Rothia sp.]